MTSRLLTLSLCAGMLAVPAYAQDADKRLVSPAEENAAELEVVVYGRLSSERAVKVPQSVEVISNKALQDSRSETVGDAIRLVPGASRDGSVFDVFGDSYLVRGFPANQTVNGMTSNALRQARDTVSIERVEVLKGPASVLYGQLQPGAVINVVTKQPRREFASELTVEGARFNDWRATADVTGPLTAGGALRFRVTGAVDSADSQIDFWHRNHFVIAPTVVADLGDRTTLAVEALFMRNELDGFLNGLPAEGTVLANPNGRLSPSLGLTDPTFDPSIRENTEVTVRLEHRFNETLRARLGASWTHELTDEDGVFGLLGWDNPYRTLTRAVLSSRSKGDAVTAYGDIAAQFQTGSVRHELMFGADHTAFDRDNLSEVGLAPSLDLYAPQYEFNQKPDTFPLPDFGSRSAERNRDTGVFVQDRLVLTDTLRLVGGVRWSQFRQETSTVQGTGGIVEDSQDQTAWTSQLGVLYSPSDRVNLFANRTTSFLPVSGITAEGLSLDPETGVQYEIGTRTSFYGNRVVLTGALFHLKRGDVAVSDRDNPSALISIGEQVSEGVEISVSATPVTGLRLYGGYALVDAKTTEDTNDALVGKRMRNVPRHSLVLRGSYQFQSNAARGLTLGAIGTYTGERAGDLEDSFELPDYWRVDLNADYPLTETVSVGASIENALDQRYYTHAYSLFEVWPGAPRTWKVNIRARF
ncbi:TonB-dependent siderophore receptor [Asticcacaulis sp. W401b]|uniref:TonB-dependent siderophore receptor n=1 Tax=Asticcacaulis sp. W401b TaxID=3388666 RepID=UPI003970D3B8